MAQTSGGSVVWELDLDKSKLSSGLNTAKGEVTSLGKEMDTTASSISSSFDKAKGASVAFGVAVAGIGAGIIAFGISSLNAFKESENAIAQTGAVLASTGGVAGVTAEHITKLAAALQKTSNFSDEAVRSSSNLLLTFTKIGSVNFDEAQQAVVDMSTAMGSDLQTASIQVGKALNDPILGINALRKVGVHFTDEQKAVIASLVETGKTAEAQKLILAELSIEFGGSAAAAAKTFAGQVKEAKDTFNDFQELLGKAIAERLTPLVTAFNDWLESMGGPAGLMEHLTNDVLPKLQAALPIIIGFIIGGLVPSFVALGLSILPLIPFIAIGTAIGAVVALLIQAFGGWEVVTKSLTAVWTSLVSIFTTFVQPALDRLKTALTSELSPALQKLWDLISPLLIPVLQLVAQIIGIVVIGALRLFIEILIVVVQNITKVITTITDLIGWFKAIPGLITGALAGVGEAILKPFRDAFDSVKNIFNDIKNKMAEISPFHRSSPSLIDNVIRGVGIIKDQFNSLDSIQFPQLAAPLLSTAPSSVLTTHETSTDTPSGVVVNMGDVTVQDQSDIGAIGREIGYRISLQPA